MARVIVKGKIEKSQRRELEELTQLLEVSSPKVRFLIGSPRMIFAELKSIAIIPDHFKRDVYNPRTRGIFVNSFQRVHGAPPTIILKEYKYFFGQHELCHLKGEESGWDAIFEISGSESIEYATQKKSHKLLHILHEDTSELLERSIAARYGFADNEISFLKERLQDDLESVMRNSSSRRKPKYYERPSSSAANAMDLAFDISTNPFGNSISSCDQKCLESLATSILAYFNRTGREMFPEYRNIVDKIEIAPVIFNLINAYKALLSSYEGILSQSSGSRN